MGKEHYLDAIVDFHQNQFKFNDLYERIFMQMYLARIPYKVHDEVGYFWIIRFSKLWWRRYGL